MTLLLDQGGTEQGDLVERLRDIHAGTPLDVACKLDDLCQEAATAIALLREERDKTWAVLMEFGYPPPDLAGPLPEATNAAIDCLIRQRNDLLREVVPLRERVRVLEGALGEEAAFWRGRKAAIEFNKCDGWRSDLLEPQHRLACIGAVLNDQSQAQKQEA